MIHLHGLKQQTKLTFNKKKQDPERELQFLRDEELWLLCWMSSKYLVLDLTILIKDKSLNDILFIKSSIRLSIHLGAGLGIPYSPVL